MSISPRQLKKLHHMIMFSQVSFPESPTFSAKSRGNTDCNEKRHHRAREHIATSSREGRDSRASLGRSSRAVGC
jgi:hypothetical protein